MLIIHGTENGACSSQILHGRLVPVAFASKTLMKRVYATNEREALGCVWACEHFSNFLLGRKFTLITDHQVLVSILSQSGTRRKAHKFDRWRARLAELDHDIQHKPGADNVIQWMKKPYSEGNCEVYMTINNAVLKAQLARLPITPENAAAFYTHAFTVGAETRKFFKGAENMAPEDVAKTKRFTRGGQRFIFSMHMVVHLANEDELFDFYITDVMDRHRGFGLPPDIYDVPFHTVWYSFLEKRVGMNEEEKCEWEKIRYQKLLPAIKKNLKGWMGED